jgi:exonuclease SbcC
MRLLSLEMAGFGTFREPARLDFADVDFFALVGPTGAGKSTVVDAICFALYGCVPRYENQNLVRYVITLGASEARVSLAFELNGTGYTATRVVRRTPKGQVSTKEARLEQLLPDGSVTTLASGANEVDREVESLLALRFEDFTRCVVLPQGEFAEFLRAKGEDRRDLLVRLLNFGVYMEVGRRAGRIADECGTAIGLLRPVLERVADATPAALRSAEEGVASLRALMATVEAARSEVEQLTRQAELEDRVAVGARRLAEALAKVDVPGDARRHGDEQARAAAALEAAERALRSASEAKQRSADEAADFPPLADLRAAAEAHMRLVANQRELADAQGLLTGARADEASAEEAVGAADSAQVAATGAAEALRTANQAAVLARKLAVGQPCPVCREVVRVLPEHRVPADLSHAEKAEGAARQTAAQLRKAGTEAAVAVARLQATADGIEVEQGRLRARLAGHPDAEPLTALLREAEQAGEAAAAAARSETDAAQARDAARGALDRLAARIPEFQAGYAAQRDAVAAAGPPELGSSGVIADWEALAAWAVPARITQEAAAGAAASAAAARRSSTAAITERLAQRAADLGAQPAGDLVGLLTALSAEATKADARVEAFAAAIAERERTETEIDDLTERAEVAAALRSHLRADRFPEWLIGEALEVLVADASRTLRALTNGAFSLALGDREFAVVDHANADEHRSARTLSGGETFQASLALALALSDQIRGLAADGAPQLDALFLDEGFGTLDAETLETVAATIENLGQSGRMVGIISHVRELADRVPVRFEIRKGPRTSSIERVNA